MSSGCATITSALAGGQYSIAELHLMIRVVRRKRSLPARQPPRRRAAGPAPLVHGPAAAPVVTCWNSIDIGENLPHAAAQSYMSVLGGERPGGARATTLRPQPEPVCIG